MPVCHEVRGFRCGPHRREQAIVDLHCIAREEAEPRDSPPHLTDDARGIRRAGGNHEQIGRLAHRRHERERGIAPSVRVTDGADRRLSAEGRAGRGQSIPDAVAESAPVLVVVVQQGDGARAQPSRGELGDESSFLGVVRG